MNTLSYSIEETAPIPEINFRPQDARAKPNLCFLCGGLEPGSDRVGDYARRLAGECRRQGAKTTLIALHDPDVEQICLEKQLDAHTPVPVLRLPATVPWSARIWQARDWLMHFPADWLSLQFVPSAFHSKGLCFGLGQRLAAANRNAAWHVMFHELWLGLSVKDSVTQRLWGGLQRRAIRHLLQQLQPRVIHTQAEPYRAVLSRESLAVRRLPLFGHIRRAPDDAWENLLQPVLFGEVNHPVSRHEFYLAGVLGEVPPEWNAERAVNVILPLVRQHNKRLALFFLGRDNLSPKASAHLKRSLGYRAIVAFLGERPGPETSRILNTLDLGLATSPQQIAEKSRAVATLREHGLPVLAVRDDWQLRQPVPLVSSVLTPEQFSALDQLPVRDTSRLGGAGLRGVTRQLLSDLANAS
ncbi:MAG TPA: hypothetical protein VF988_15080 [Verrucomicrobiae bacterium]